MHNLGRLKLVIAVVLLAAAMAASAGTLIDVAFTSASVTSKTGFAATEVSANDFWNTYDVSAPDLTNLAFVDGRVIDVAFTGNAATAKTGFAAAGVTTNDFWNSYEASYAALSNLRFVDGTVSGAGLTVVGVQSVYGNGASDPMYGTYFNYYLANMTVEVTNLFPFVYNLFIYGHGDVTGQNGVYQLSVGSQSYGTEATITGAGWLSPIWQEGVQYVEFTNVSVPAGKTVTITVEPGPGAFSVISGLQITPVGSTSSNAFIAIQPTNQAVAQGTTATFSVAAGGASPLAFQWLFNNAIISTATNSSYSVFNARPSNVGYYSVIVTNAYGSVTSLVAPLNVIVAPVTKVIDVAFTSSSVTGETGFAATGVTIGDFWNTYVVNAGAVPNLEFMDGSGSGAGLTVANAGAANTNGASDPMYGTYLYPVSGGNITISVTNLNPGAYDLYLYGHGIQSNQNSVFRLNVGSQSYGSEATINGSGWLTSIWQEGVQYVRLTNVSVSTGQTITVTVRPGASATGVISGIQIATVASNTSAAYIITPPQPTNQSVLQFTKVPYIVSAGGALPLAYQWLLNGTAISTGTNSTYTVPLAEPTNAGNYSVIVSNAYGMATSQLATLSVVPAPVANIGPFVNGSFETPVVTNGNDQYLPPGSTWLTGWMVGGTVEQVFVFNAPFAGLSAVDGQQWVVFDSQIAPPGGELSQTFSTIPGETYLLTYSEAPALYYSYPPSKSLWATVCAGDGTFLAGNESLFTPPYATTWSTVRLTFTAKTTGTTLLFTDASVPAYDTSVALDAVSVVALPANSPPLIINASNQTVNVNQGVVVTNYAYSANGPISFALAVNSPTGASITTNGIFSWVPTCGQGSTTNLITVWATDSSIPPLSNSMTFTVSVGECVEISIGSSVVQAGQNTCVPVNLLSTVGLTNLSFTLAYTSGFLTNWNITSSNSAVASTAANTVDPSHTQFNFGLQNGKILQGTSLLGSICLDTLPGTSAFVPLAVVNIDAVASNTPATNLIAQMGRLVVIGRQSLLDPSLGTNSSLTLTLYGNPGVSYDLLTTTNLIGGSWSTVGSVTLTDLFQVISLGGATNQMQFFKAVQP